MHYNIYKIELDYLQEIRKSVTFQHRETRMYMYKVTISTKLSHIKF